MIRDREPSAASLVSLVSLDDDDDDDDDDAPPITFPVHQACWYNDVAALGRLLRDPTMQQSLVTQCTPEGMTPLHVACLHGSLECARLLCERGATVNSCPEVLGCAPLHSACRKGRDACVSLLLERRAQVNLADKTAWTPLQIACHEGRPVCVRLLCESRAAVNLVDGENQLTPLHRASHAGHAECAALLVGSGAKVNAADGNGRMPLHHACLRGYAAVVALLCDNRAALDAAPANGMTALHAACYQGNASCTRTLIEHGAPLALKDVDGDTAEDVARERGHDTCVLLVQAGAAQRAEEEAAMRERAAQAARQAEAMAALLLAEEEEEERQRRDRPEKPNLQKKRKKERQKLRRANAQAVEMQPASEETRQAVPEPVHACIQELTLAEATNEAAGATAGEGGTATAVALTLAELEEATVGFGDQKLIGSGGYGRVYTADALPSLPPEALPSRLRELPVAVKRAKSGSHDLTDLRREVHVLQQCSHPHLLPLLGYYLAHEAPCLVFPLMRGGSLANRLWPLEANPEHLRRLGLSQASLRPLRWHQRLRILRQATDALLYLHTPVAKGKGSVIHRDFKPENILLDDDLNAYLADTGFAKMDAGPESSRKSRSQSHALYLTKGYLDPIIVEGREYSAITDGWALGITILVVLTGRSPLSIINRCEEDFDEDFEELDAARIADVTADWPVDEASALKELVRSANHKCLCHPSSRKRLAVADALAALTSLADEGRDRGSSAEAVDAASGVKGSATPTGIASNNYMPTPLSMQVREMRKGGERNGGDAQKGIKDNMLLAFNCVMPQLDTIFSARSAEAPKGFEERIHFWHRECAMPPELTDQLHTLRIWANAARHHDNERWRRHGPADEAEALRLVSAVRSAIEAITEAHGHS